MQAGTNPRRGTEYGGNDCSEQTGVEENLQTVRDTEDIVTGRNIQSDDLGNEKGTHSYTHLSTNEKGLQILSSECKPADCIRH